jgi:hypothetical protein
MTQRETVLTMLEQAGREGVSNGQFAEAGILRYSARIMELRKAGHLIEKHQVSAGTFRYELRRVHQACRDEEAEVDSRQGSSALPIRESRAGSSAGEGTQPLAGTSIPAATSSGTGADTRQDGDQIGGVAVLPTLFEMPRSGAAGHYGEDAA